LFKFIALFPLIFIEKRAAELGVASHLTKI